MIERIQADVAPLLEEPDAVFEVDETGPQRDDPPTVARRPFKIQ